MKTINPRSFVLVVAAVAVSVAFYRRPAEWPVAPAPQAVPADMAAPVTAAPDTRALRPIVKSRLARDVIAGRRTLWEAAALFGEVNALPPAPVKPGWMDDSVRIPIDTEDSWLCRQVAEFVRVELAAEPGRAAAAIARLEAAVRQASYEHGAIRLSRASARAVLPVLLDEAREEFRATRAGAGSPRVPEAHAGVRTAD